MSQLMTAIGLMSGTSMDGIDLAVMQTDGEGRIHRDFPSASLDYSLDDQERIKSALETAKAIGKREERPGDLAEIEAMITRRHADLVSGFLAQHGKDLPPIDLIGFHGQTVLHRPDEGLTVQLGDGALLASLCSIPVVHDMRANDMRHGGQGAPLVPVYHQALSKNLPGEYGELAPVVFVNIGGISNITYVDGETLIAFDTGPGNTLIDQWVNRHLGISHDAGGMIAMEGVIDEDLVRGYLADPYYEQPLPKSLDRGDFKLPVAPSLSIETGARSLARVTAEAILRGGEHLPKSPKLWVISGGGRHNPHIMADLSELAQAHGGRIASAEAVNLSTDMMEAEAWAYLAVRSVKGLPLTFPATTGCKRPVSGGLLAKPVKRS